MAQDQTLNHEYLPVTGLPDYKTAATRLLLGPDSPAIAQSRVSCLGCPHFWAEQKETPSNIHAAAALSTALLFHQVINPKNTPVCKSEFCSVCDLGWLLFVREQGTRGHGKLWWLGAIAGKKRRCFEQIRVASDTLARLAGGRGDVAYICLLWQADGVQAIGGTGALRVGFDFLRTRVGLTTLYVSSPTWGQCLSQTISLFLPLSLSLPVCSCARC